MIRGSFPWQPSGLTMRYHRWLEALVFRTAFRQAAFLRGIREYLSQRTRGHGLDILHWSSKKDSLEVSSRPRRRNCSGRDMQRSSRLGAGAADAIWRSTRSRAEQLRCGGMGWHGRVDLGHPLWSIIGAWTSVHVAMAGRDGEGWHGQGWHGLGVEAAKLRSWR